jgi:hypothetical protein
MRECESWVKMLCCAVLCCAVVCCGVLCCAVLCCAVLCCAVLCCGVLCYAVLYCAVLWCTVLCCAVLYCTVVYCDMLWCTVLCCGVLCCTVVYCGVLWCTVLCCTNFFESILLLRDTFVNIDFSVFLSCLFHVDFEYFSVLFCSISFSSCTATVLCLLCNLKFSKLINWSFENTSQNFASFFKYLT